MLITFSGPVGSGKSTNARAVYRTLAKRGLPVTYLRFRFVTVRSFFQPLPTKRLAGGDGEKKVRADRKAGEELALRSGMIRAMGLHQFTGYVWRMLLFRLFAKFKLGGTIGICDRYFFDNFAHFDFSRRKWRRRILQKLLPAPDLAFMLTAAPEILARRRPSYQAAYLKQLGQNYARLPDLFSHLHVVKTDDPSRVSRHIDKILWDYLAMQSRPAPGHMVSADF